MRFLGLYWVFLVVLTGCSSPQFQPLGDETLTPYIDQDAFVMADGYRLPFSMNWPKEEPRALVVSLHGFNDYSRAFEGFCEYLLEKGFACIAYDQRGFGKTSMRGLWPQEGQHQKDLKQILLLLKQRYPDLDTYFAGESMGGAVIMSALSEEAAFWRANLEGVILFAPAVWARSTQPWYQRAALWLAVHTFPGWKPTGESLEIVATDNREALREMSRDENVIKETRIDAVYGLTNLMDHALNSAEALSLDTLVLYGERDEVIPKHPTCEMLRRFDGLETQPSVLLYPNGYHMLTRDLQAKTVFQDVVTWMNQGEVEVSKERLANFCS